MLTEDILKDVQAIFGDKNEVQIEIQDLLRWVNDGQLQVAKDTGCIQRTQTISVLAGDFDHPLNQDFLKYVRVTWDGLPMLRSTSAELDEVFGDTSTVPILNGIPTRFYHRNKTLFLYPSPERDGTLEILYTARPVDVVSTSQPLEIPGEMHPLLKNYLLSRAYELDENFAQASAKEAKFEKQVNEAKANEKNPHEDSYAAVRTLEDDAW
jgi:hypothetical protein